MTRQPEEYGVLMTTTADRATARAIADALLGARLAACVQVMPIESHYMWQGSARRDSEFMLLVKTRVALFDRAIGAIRARHPYAVPEIVGAVFGAGYGPYLAWIDEVTG